MAYQYINPTPGWGAVDAGVKTLDGRPSWAAPDSSRLALDARPGWSAPETSHIYGVRFPGFPADTKGVRTGDAKGFGDVHPAVSNGTGNSPFDDIYPWCEMKQEERIGGTMVKIPVFWYKLKQDGKCVAIEIADHRTPGFHISPAHMDRNDGKGERDVVYVGRYHCAENTYRSTTGVKPKCWVTKDVMYSACHNVGDSYYMMDFATRFTLWLLYLVECAEWNSQSLIGFGCGSSLMVMGSTDRMQYCTGTAQSSASIKDQGTQYRNIEGLWDNVYDWLSGCYSDNSELNIILDSSKLGNSAGGKSISVSQAGGYAGELKISNASEFPLFYNANSSGGSSMTGICDQWLAIAGRPMIYAGGYARGPEADNEYDGMFLINMQVPTWTGMVGARLMELP